MMVTGLLGEGHCCGVAADALAGCRAAAGDVAAGLELGLIGNGQAVVSWPQPRAVIPVRAGCAQPGRSPRPGGGAGAGAGGAG